ncbi:MAG TPA: hypothetical protein PLL30_01625 [Candidatus Krumholzibacteria bacterium]|nr:hypothetical protein [Candidatus Krumholzibacteria bacterium]HPD70464.1 hypothetical protein [Candidatus Krumholzibacteria bacterium]HRY39836.1 hypothetical protein [Candidatus Krumholzibacteria bacterium]
MNKVIVLLLTLLTATVAFADKPIDGVVDVNQIAARINCPFGVQTYVWDFNQGSHGFTTSTCDASGGVPAWAYGAEPNLAGYTVWGTVLGGNYPASTGEALVSPSFLVTPATSLVQVTHYFDTELNYDGCNLMAGDQVIIPMEGYTIPAISPSTSYYAYCVEGQPGYSGHDLADWTLITSCFDISALMGETVDLRFQFGADTSVQYPGWYLASVIVGGETGVPVEAQTWSAVKGLFN